MFANSKLRAQIVVAKVEKAASTKKQSIVQKHTEKTNQLKAELASIKK